MKLTHASMKSMPTTNLGSSFSLNKIRKSTAVKMQYVANIAVITPALMPALPANLKAMMMLI